MNFLLNHISLVRILINFIDEMNDIFDDMQNVMKIRVIHIR